jgi:signal transduction histidine kinase
MATLKEVSFRILSEGPNEASWKVVGNLAKLERVLFNLLENALRHTHEGTQIAIRLRDEGAFIRVSIKDQGVGVPPELMDSLFERGRQGGENSGNAGLGLYFCKITVEDWGGTLGCLPNLKDGACFWFRLPKAGEASARP